MEKKALGYYGEQAALAYVRHEKGYHVRCCNYRNRLGEIDLIAEDGHTLVFIEVKTRTTAAYGLPCEAVERNKRRKITRVASAYLAQFDPGGTRYPPPRPRLPGRKAVRLCSRVSTGRRRWA